MTSEHQGTPGEAANRPADASICLMLSPSEAEIVRVGLQELLYSAAREEHLAAPIHSLLARLKEAR